MIHELPLRGVHWPDSTRTDVPSQKQCFSFSWHFRISLWFLFWLQPQVYPSFWKQKQKSNQTKPQNRNCTHTKCISLPPSRSWGDLEIAYSSFPSQNPWMTSISRMHGMRQDSIEKARFCPITINSRCDCSMAGEFRLCSLPTGCAQPLPPHNGCGRYWKSHSWCETVAEHNVHCWEKNQHFPYCPVVFEVPWCPLFTVAHLLIWQSYKTL